MATDKGKPWRRSIESATLVHGRLLRANDRATATRSEVVGGFELAVRIFIAGGTGALADAIASLERQTLDAPGVSGTVLRYGWFYGPGTTYDPQGTIPTAIRAGVMPVVGDGAGRYSFISLRDAAEATLKALGRETSGIYNIVDDSPVRFSEWLPFAARLLGAPDPGHIDEASARQKFGDMRVYYMNEQRGASNARAKRDFEWRPVFPSWRTGFEALYSNASSGSV